VTTPQWLHARGYRHDINYPPPNWFRTAWVNGACVRLSASVGEPREDVIDREKKVGVCDS
jgi:hypothetical protein